MFYSMMLGYIFGIDCQTTLQVQEKLISRLPVEIYVQCHIRKRRIVDRIKLKHDFVKHTRHMAVTIALPQN